MAKSPEKATYHYGDVVELTANPNTGWQFAGWSGALSGSENPKTITIDGNKTVTASFTQITTASTIGTAFTYQGRLIDNDQPANGQYDFQFKLYDSALDGNQIGGNVNVSEIQVNDGYFSVELDFGDVFDGNKRWLEIGVRPSEQNDPNVYTTLSPRQELTPTPYAIYAETAGSGDSLWKEGMSQVYGSNIYYTEGNVGIGITGPNTTLDINGALSVRGMVAPATSPSGQGRIYFDSTSNKFKVSENASSYTDLVGGGMGGSGTANYIPKFTASNTLGNSAIYETGGNVGIGTGPNAKLSIKLDNYATEYIGANIGPLGNTCGTLRVGIGDNLNTPPWFPVFTAYVKYGDHSWIEFWTATYDYMPSEKVRITNTGNVGIGTTNPAGKLDVNGSIYQRGSILHADYVFEPGYKLESIDEHSDFMWQEKHLPAMPKIQKDENGQEMVEIGARSRGVVEELEKAHIYIEQLHKNINQLQDQNKKLQDRISAMEAIMNELAASQEGGAR